MLRVRSLVTAVFLISGLLAGSFQPGVLPAAAQLLPVPSAPEFSLGQPGTNYRYVQTFGETEVAYPSDAAHLNYPWGLTTSGNSVWIGEYWGNRALKYSQTGAFQMQIGEAGVADIYDTVLYGITDVGADASGNIWIVDGDASHVIEFDGSGNRIGELGVAWEWGADNNHFGHPVSIAFDAAGNIYVSDGSPWYDSNVGNHRVQVFDSAGSYLATIGQAETCGTGNHQFCGPRHIAVYGTQLYVSDAGNHRVQVFDVSTPAAPAYVATMGVTGVPGDDAAHFERPSGVAVDANYIYIADTSNNRVKIYNRSNRAYVTTVGTGWGSGSDQFRHPSDVAVDAAGYLYVADFINTRVQQFSQAGGVWSYTRTYGQTFEPYVTDGLHYNRPSGVAVSRDGDVYITEDFGHRLVKLNANGAFLWSVGAAGVKGDWVDGNDRLNNPSDVDLDSSGKVYVADRWNGRVQIYNPDGSYSATVPDLWCPGGLDVAPNDFLYVADSCQHTVNIYNSSLNFVAQIGVSGVAGADETHFNWPDDVAVDSNGQIYISDNGNSRVQVFNASRTYVRTMGETGVWSRRFDRFNGPNGLAVDGANRVFVSDQGNNRIQVFDSTGAYLTTIGGSWGSQNGQVQAPEGVAVDASGNVYIADWGNHRIQKYAPGVPGWRQVNINGFGRPSAEWVPSLEEFQNQLYAGTGNWQFGAQVWRLESDGQWLAASEFGFGSTYTNTNAVVLDMIVFENQLYASTGWGGAIGQVWRTQDGAAWQPVTTNGFNDAENIAMTSFAEYNGMLYVGTSNPTSGAQIWRSDSGAPGSWDKVAPEAAGSAGTANVTGIAAFNGQLFAAVESENPGQVWRSPDGSDWTVMVDDGFGDPENMNTGGFAVFNNTLYLGVRNNTTGGQIWKTDGTTWTQAVGDGFGDPRNVKVEGLIVFEDDLYAVTNNDITGMQVWRTPDGAHWVQVGPEGFGDSNNTTTLWSNAVVLFKDNLYIGTYNNANGGEVWQLLDNHLFFPLLARNR